MIKKFTQKFLLKEHRRLWNEFLKLRKQQSRFHDSLVKFYNKIK